MHAPRHRLAKKFLLMAFVFGFQNAHAQNQASDSIEPEQASSVQLKAIKSLLSDKDMVVSANPNATQAGLDVLAKGGTAIDAMVAVQTVLGLVEPQSSGLGGGAFAVYYDNATQKIHTFDGRETAPLAAQPDLFLKADQSPMQFFEAVVGGRSVGTPGTVALLGELHQRYGKLAWPSLFEAATTLATEGFEVSPRLAQAVEKDQARLSIDPDTRAYFIPKGKALRVKETLRNPAYAASLKHIAKHGAAAFYKPEFAQVIVDKVRSASNAGVLSLKDFKDYRVIERPSVCMPYRAYEVCGMGPPSSGAIAVGQILGILENTLFASLEPESVQSWHLIAEATRMAFADRNRYVADTDFINMPNWLLEPEYLKQRAQQIPANKPSEKIVAGTYANEHAAYYQGLINGLNLDQPSTTHFVIADRHGNVVSTTSTIENGFGSRLMAHGFMLNNELTDFSFAYENEAGLIANRVEAGKRPRSSMAPTIVLKDNKPYLALGSPGGSRIITYVANTLIRVLDWHYTPLQAVNAPHLSNRFGSMDIEPQGIESALKTGLTEFGYKVVERDLNSGLHVIKFEVGKLMGAADPRREGAVAGN